MNWNGLELPPTYYQDDAVYHLCGDALRILPELPSDSIDLLATDPPYGIGFMGKDWDKALPDKEIWQECFRVLKDGAFAFVMSIPRADCLSRMIISLEDAGFWVNFTPIFWAYASGFPKAQNIGKAVDKRLGAEREVIGRQKITGQALGVNKGLGLVDTEHKREWDLTISATPQAKELDGSYGGFQPKPAVEVIIVAMKPLSEKTFVDQALKNKKGITWLDDGRIPYESEGDIQVVKDKFRKSNANDGINATIGISNKNQLERQDRLDFNRGRFPANLLVSDDALNDGNISRQGIFKPRSNTRSAEQFSPSKGWHDHNMNPNNASAPDDYGDSGSFSRYFDLDKWFAEKIKQLPQSVQKTFPFLIVPKASKGEKNKYLDGEKLPVAERAGRDNTMNSKLTLEGKPQSISPPERNFHPTVKPLKLMSYLITLGSREGDIALDPFSGSGTTLLSAQLLNRKCIGIEIKEIYCEIAAKRCSQSVMRLEI